MKLSIWLTPAQRSRADFCSAISSLAAAFGAPTFEPHITVATSHAAADVVTEALRVAAKEARTVPVSAAAIGYSPNFLSGLYVVMDTSQPFQDLVRTVVAGHKSLHALDTEPRLSLLYKPGNEARKRQVSESLDFIGKTYEFDALKVVRMRDVIETERDIIGWSVRSTIKLLPREARADNA